MAQDLKKQLTARIKGYFANFIVNRNYIEIVFKYYYLSHIFFVILDPGTNRPPYLTSHPPKNIYIKNFIPYFMENNFVLEHKK